MITSPIRKQAIRRAMQQHYQQEREALYNADTVRMQTTDSMQQLSRTTRPMLPLDVTGRPYIMVSDSKDTLTLIKELVASYFAYQQTYPSVILLSPLRYLMLVGKATHYQINDNFISLKFDDASYVESDFDVLVRGEV